MDDQNDTDGTNTLDGADTFVPGFHLTSKNKLLVEEITEGTTMLHRYQPPRVSWTQRVLGWFRKN